MALFKVAPRDYVVFDVEKIKELTALTPYQILELLCASFQATPEGAILMQLDSNTYKEKYPEIAHLLKVKTV